MSGDVLVLCTYFDSKYLTRGLALYQSIAARATRPFILYVLCFDDASLEALQTLALPDLIPISSAQFEEGDEGLAAARRNRTRVEYYWTCTASLLAYVGRSYREGTVVTYLDADMLFYACPSIAVDQIEDHAVLVVEHRFGPHLAATVRTAGRYNVGLVAYRTGGQGSACIEDWRKRCNEWCYARFEDGKYADQKYLDAWPDRFENVVVSRHPGVGIAPWNVDAVQCTLTKRGVFVDGEPLVFFHFHGFRYLGRHTCIPAGAHFRLPVHVFRRLCRGYSQALRRAWQTLNPGKGRHPGEGGGALSVAWHVVTGNALHLGYGPAALLNGGAFRLCRFRGHRRQRAVLAHAAGRNAEARALLLLVVLLNPFELRFRLVRQILGLARDADTTP